MHPSPSLTLSPAPGRLFIFRLFVFRLFVFRLQVQLQLLTATVKLFLKRPTESAQQMAQLVLSAATSETDNPDLRDRAYVYWRLLSTDPEVSQGGEGRR